MGESSSTLLHLGGYPTALSNFHRDSSPNEV
jgi:hypothetical protein